MNKSPVYNVIAVPIEQIQANAYNPNSVAPPEMKLLELSIWEDGYTMPIVCYYLPGIDKYEIVYGYHRYTTMIKSDRIREREGGLGGGRKGGGGGTGKRRERGRREVPLGVRAW